MNTPAHLILGLAALGRRGDRRRDAAVLAGSIAPDVPMFLFYLWQRLVLDHPERQIWTTEYFRSSWQLFFDVFNSIPGALLGLALTWRRDAAWPRFFFGAVILHCLVDLLLHHDDGHRHWLPVSGWRFESPVSYWDSAHYGAFGAGLESVVIVVGCGLLWQRHVHAGLRIALLALCALYGLAFGALYL